MSTQKTEEKSRGRINAVIGTVVSDKMDKTITVKVFRKVRHTQYLKFVRRSTTYKAHDEKNEATMGDKVEIIEARPLSKTKRWKLSKVVESAKKVGV